MGFEEKLAETQAKMEELKAQLTESLDAAKAAREEKTSTFVDKFNAFASDPDAINKVFDNLDEKLANAISEGIDTVEDAITGAAEKIEDAAKTAEGNYYAAQENLRIARENYESKLNSERLEVQMRLENLRSKIAEKKDSVDKAVQEEVITDLLCYAQDCQSMSLFYAQEADLAMKDAKDLIDDFNKKYGEAEA